MMATNLFNKEHKATSKNYRKGYDQIRWEKQGEQKQGDDPEEPAK
jgi:hypothetical protein